ncbi:MAG: N-6 DNA methylase, partial [Candidatus Sericytochromatia bacterium]|nr:N-6 DNA methylase [Candidatus Tanganyikabacteria bacterium]
MPGEALLAHEAARRADRRAREGHGAVYTPGWLADLIVRETFALAPHNPTICDPACGAGHLLVTARNVLSAGTEAAATRTKASLAPGSALFGVDRDPEAIELARA